MGVYTWTLTLSVDACTVGWERLIMMMVMKILFKPILDPFVIYYRI